jgi:hypothetical protein
MSRRHPTRISKTLGNSRKLVGQTMRELQILLESIEKKGKWLKRFSAGAPRVQ